ncbi:MAG: hypothetical protein IJS90_07115 [Clostridia bacterium]|nr:hypothetical protein [Clostridia bacterium]
MKKNSKKLLSVLLSVLMVLSVIPMSFSAFAADDEQTGFINACVGMDDYSAPALGEEGGEGGEPAASDASFSLVSEGRLPAVRNQGGYGTCWSFGTLAAVESNLITQGLADTSIDLSELQLVYYMYHPTVDPLGNATEGEGSARVDGDTVTGGRGDYAMNVLAHWNGLADESTVPYSWAYSIRSGARTLTPDYATEYNRFVINGYYAINNQENAAELKAAIREYGAATVSYFHDDKYINDNYAFFSGSNNEGRINHEVAIVGWDDSYSKDNFGDEGNNFLKPENDGAWLIRNSWDDDWGNDGYFWLSYEDKSIEDTSLIVKMQPADAYDNNYFYDGGAMYSPSAKVFGAVNIFEAKKEAELLKAVSVSFPTETDVDYSVDIYVDPVGTDFLNDPSQSPVASAHTDGSTTFAGMYTIELNNPVALVQGQKFAVVIRTDEPARIGYDKEYDAYWFQNNVTFEEGVSYFIGSGSRLVSMEERGIARVKAYTETVDENTVTISVPDRDLYVGDVLSANDYSLEVDPSDAELTFAVADTSVATVTADGTLTAVAEGSTSLEIRCAAANTKATALINVLPHTYTLVQAVDATCTEDGSVEYYVCSHGDKFTLEEGEYVPVADENDLVIEALGHTSDPESEVEAVEVTEYTDGNVGYYTCSRCGSLIAYDDATDSYVEIAEGDIVIPAEYYLGKVYPKANTCTKDGNIEYFVVYDKATGEAVTYTVTDEETGDEIEKTKYVVYNADTGAYDVVDEADVIIPAGHDLEKTEAVAPSCATGTIGNIEYYHCSVCDKYFTDEECENEISYAQTLSYPVHTMTKTDAVPATCTETGNVQYYYCSVCSRYFKYASGSTLLYMEDDPENGITGNIIIPATGHQLRKIEANGPVCEVKGNPEYYVCKACGKYFVDETCEEEFTEEDLLEALDHVEDDGEITLAPTCTEPGLKTYTCTLCGKTTKQEVLAPLGHNMENGTCTECGLSESEIHSHEIAELGGEICEYCGKRHGTSWFSDILYAVHGIFKFFHDLFSRLGI